MVLDGVVRAARQQLGDLGPLVAQPLVGLDDDAVLVLGPRRLVDARMQMVVPPAVSEGWDGMGTGWGRGNGCRYCMIYTLKNMIRTKKV